MGVTPWAGRLRLRRLGCGVLIVVLSGCAVARSAGSGAAEGAVARLKADTTLQVLSRDLADSTVARLGVKFASDVLDPAKATWGEMRRDAGDEAETIRRDLDQWVKGDLNRAVGDALSDNSAILDARLQVAAGGAARAFIAALSRALTEQLAPAGDTVMMGLLRAAAVGMEVELRPTLHALMREVQDSLQSRIRDVDDTVAGSRSVTGLRAGLLGAGAVALLVALIVVVGHRRRHERALHVLIDAIDTAGDERIREAVGSLAAKAGVRGWLGDRVRTRRACRPEGPAGRGESG